MKDVLSVILGGGRGVRLYPLTKERAKPAVPLGGKYRLIDIPISNCLHSGLNKIYVLTQFNSQSLNRHVSRTYRFDMFSEGFVEILAAQQTPEDITWYQGTADAVRQNLRVFDQPDIRYILILSGDQLYQMTFQKLLEEHTRTDAEVTIAVIPVSARDATRYGILKTDDPGRIVEFVEKPQDPMLLKDLAVSEKTLREHGIDAQGRSHLASMGIYLFNKEVLLNLLIADATKTDFGKEVIPDAIHRHRVFGFYFDGYWEDIGTIRAYYQASMGFLEESPTFNFWGERLLYTRPRHLPASRIYDCRVSCSMLADGCTIRADTIEHSIIGVRSIIGKGCVIRESILMGADYYETEERKAVNRLQNIPDIGIGQHCRIEGAIIDKNARIGDNVTIERFPDDYELDESRYVIQEGVVVIPR
ncbi:MAG: glucose-1-phosphate adenylyltransferase, partial [Candidatus Latescibacteria bacterium]|nr:glucose-1-phosphate adenylyltransferase [Candidatus Latescibacterota bacterium]